MSLERGDGCKMHHYWTVDGGKQQPLIRSEGSPRWYADVRREFAARSRDDELEIRIK
jgi:hypothetical protein